jgi:hypothetical protein
VGDGISDLENKDLTESAREAIATGLGIPHSILFSNASNYATSQQDFRNFYNLTINPLAGWIADCINDQLLTRAGLRLEFHPEELEYFQDDELAEAETDIKRAQAMRAYMDIGFSMLHAADLANIELTDEMRAEIERKQAEEAQEETQEEQAPPLPMPQAQPEMDDDESDEMQAKTIDQWRRFAIRLGVKGKERIMSFDKAADLGETGAAIIERLQSANTNDDIRAAFDVVPVKRAEPSEAALILEGIRLAVEAHIAGAQK